MRPRTEPDNAQSLSRPKPRFVTAEFAGVRPPDIEDPFSLRGDYRAGSDLCAGLDR